MYAFKAKLHELTVIILIIAPCIKWWATMNSLDDYNTKKLKLLTVFI